ncbi:MAG TPA: hypothetical protein PL048_18645 [Leptospiraceae bacterium]|nr:hypothetical protein [Leptospiraceae bacterium]HMZ60802.1 hypothetical protein [Leptospiraceae bacterium]
MKFYLFILFFMLGLSLSANETIELTENVEDANYKVVRLLNRLSDNTTVPVEKTRGFNYRYATAWYTPYRYEVYVGKMGKKNETSLIRIEAPRRGEAKVLRSIFEEEILQGESEKNEAAERIRSKSHILNQGFNMLAPSLGILHSGYNSPFYQSGEMYQRAAIFALVDIVIIGVISFYAQSTAKKKSYSKWITHLGEPSNVNLMEGRYHGLVLGLLIIPRLIRAADGFSEVATQNRMAELSYTVRF